MVLGEGSFTYPVWAPSGDRIAYGNNRDILWKGYSTGTPTVLLENPNGDVPTNRAPSPYFFTPDGSALVLRDQDNPETGDDLVMLPVGGDQTPIWRLAGPFNERNAELSPDGRWVAYESDESGAFEIYVRPFPDVEGDQVRVSNAGGRWPLWTRAGSELLYLQPGLAGYQLMSASVTTGGSSQAFTFGERTALFDWPYFVGAEGRSYDVSLDGERFLAIKAENNTAGAASVDITVVLNWFTELRQRMGTP
jgi:serine/threonine-protein kinase